MVSTSEKSKAHFEVWMPLPEGDVNDAIDRSIQVPINSDPRKNEALILKSKF